MITTPLFSVQFLLLLNSNCYSTGYGVTLRARKHCLQVQVHQCMYTVQIAWLF